MPLKMLSTIRVRMLIKGLNRLDADLNISCCFPTHIEHTQPQKGGLLRNLEYVKDHQIA